MSVLLPLGKSSMTGSLGVQCYNHPMSYQLSYVFSPPALVPLVVSKLLVEHITGQSRLFILMAPYWMEASWLPTVLNMLADIPHYCSVTKDLIMDVLVGQVLKSLQSLYLALWLFRDMCCPDKGSLPQSVRWWQGQLMCL